MSIKNKFFILGLMFVLFGVNTAGAVMYSQSLEMGSLSGDDNSISSGEKTDSNVTEINNTFIEQNYYYFGQETPATNYVIQYTPLIPYYGNYRVYTRSNPYRPYTTGKYTSNIITTPASHSYNYSGFSYNFGGSIKQGVSGNKPASGIQNRPLGANKL